MAYKFFYCKQLASLIPMIVMSSMIVFGDDGGWWWDIDGDQRGVPRHLYAGG